MIGLGALTGGVWQWGTGPGLLAAGVSVLLVEVDRRSRRVAEGQQP